MQKLKTRKSAKKRYKKISTNKYSYHHAYLGHLLTHKTKKQKRKLCVKNCIKRSDTLALNLMLPYS